MGNARPGRHIQRHVDSSKAQDDLTSQATKQMTCSWISSKNTDHTQKDIYLSPSAEKKAHSIQSCAKGCLQGKHSDPPAASLMSERHLTQRIMVRGGYSEVICKKLLALLKNTYEKARLEPRAHSLADITCVTATQGWAIRT